MAKKPSLNPKIKSKEGDRSLSRSYSKRGLSSSYSKDKTAVTPTALVPDDLKDLSRISHPLDKTLVESTAFVPEDISTVYSNSSPKYWGRKRDRAEGSEFWYEYLDDHD
jgi:hypothetical protein